MLSLIVLAAILPLLNVLVVALYICLSRRLPSTDPESDYYDEDGNHIYYDRKLIAALEKEKRNVEDAAEKNNRNELTE